MNSTHFSYNSNWIRKGNITLVKIIYKKTNKFHYYYSFFFLFMLKVKQNFEKVVLIIISLTCNFIFFTEEGSKLTFCRSNFQQM